MTSSGGDSSRAELAAACREAVDFVESYGRGTRRARYVLDILREALARAGEDAAPAAAATVEDVKEAARQYFSVEVVLIDSPSRSVGAVRARHVAMYVARHRTAASYPELARAFGGRDHTTVMAAVRKIDSLRHVDRATAQAIDGVDSRLTDVVGRRSRGRL